MSSIRPRFRVGRCATIAAAIVAGAAGADAADYSNTVPAPVHRCDLAGFIELPGTDVCLKLGGHARYVATAIDKDWLGTNSYEVRNIAVDGYTVPPSGVVPAPGFGFQDETLQMYGQGRVNVDARTVTGLGTLRAFIEAQANDNDTNTGGSLNLRHAYVQFGNWTFGKTWSTFINSAFGRNYTDPFMVVGDNSEGMRRNQIRYTQEFGSGLSLSLAVEDPNYNTPPAAIVGLGPLVPIANPAATALSVVNDRNDVPDAVAALKWEDEDIGLVQLAAAVHRNRYAEQQTIGGVPIQSFSDGDIGFALSLGASLKMPTGKDDRLTLLTNYTDGASQYLPSVYGSSTEVVWGRCGIANCILDRVRKWSVFSTFTHNWTPTFATIVGGGYAETDYGAAGTALGPAGTPAGLNVQSLEGFATFRWDPVERTTFKLDVHYGHIDYDGFDLDPVLAGSQDAQGAWATTFEVTRRF